MSNLVALPIILVSAKSEEAASYIISEIIDNVPLEQTDSGSSKGPGPQSGEGGGEGEGGGRVWHIHNKYYSADVRLVPLADGHQPPTGLTVEGHLIYLAPDECSCEIAERRYSAGAGAGTGAGLRVLVCDSVRVEAALCEWAGGRRVEPVALRCRTGAGSGPDSDSECEWECESGPAAVRMALQVHYWPSATLHTTTIQNNNRTTPLLGSGSGSESPEGWMSEDEADEELDLEGQVERMEGVAAALEAARGARGGDRREALCLALLRAMGASVHDI